MSDSSPRMFTVKLVGERKTYGLRGSEEHATPEMANFLSDVTGYRPVYISNMYLDKLKVGKSVDIDPANSIGTTPRFRVTRTV